MMALPPSNTPAEAVGTSKATFRLVLSALFLALGYVLPFLTGQIREIGNMLLPMHLPVLLCGMVCGWKYGCAVGFILPLTRSLFFGMPVIFPAAISMAFELATYGLIIGLIYSLIPKQSLLTVYISLLSAMAAGRLVWGAAQAILLGCAGRVFTFELFMAGALLNAIPGIVIQLILVPAVILTLHQTHLIPFRKAVDRKDK